MMLVAPEVVVPAERVKSATIYWIDAQFGLPTPAITPAGTKQALTTTIWRQTNRSPRPGWIVRYEVACGPPAVFGSEGKPWIETLTNETGQASAEIIQKDPSPGTNQVRVQVFRPADSCGQRQLVREGSVLVTWTAPSLGIRQFGPATAAIDQNVTYHVEVSNPGDLPARDVVATEEVPEGLSFLQANPPPVVDGRRLQWRLGDLVPQQKLLIEATFRTMRPGAISHCVEVTGAGGLRSSHCADTNVLAAVPAPATEPPPGPAATRPGPSPTPAARATLEVKVTTAEANVAVGSDVTFDVVLTNRGTATATGINVRDTFDAGLEPQEGSPTTGSLDDLAPGHGATFAFTFHVARLGQLCQHVEVTAAGGARAVADSCITGVAAASRPGPGPGTASPGNPTVSVSGPATSTVGKSVVFSAEITNLGQKPLTNLVVSQSSDAALVVTLAASGAKPGPGGNAWVWTLPSLEPGRPIQLRVQCDCRQPAARACCRFTVTANGQPIEGQTCVEIAAAPAPRSPRRRFFPPRPPDGWRCLLIMSTRSLRARTSGFWSRSAIKATRPIMTLLLRPISRPALRSSSPGPRVRTRPSVLRSNPDWFASVRWPHCSPLGRPRRRSATGWR